MDPLKVVLVHAIYPRLTNFPDLLAQHRPSVPLGHLAGRLDHPARLVVHELHHLEGTHAPVLALAALNRQQLQQRLVDLELQPRKGGTLRVRRGRRVDKVSELRAAQPCEEVLLFQLVQLRLLVGVFGLVGSRAALPFAILPCRRLLLLRRAGRKGDGEVELGEQRTREVRVLIAALEDYAVELVVGNGDREVALVLAA
jgi:hypothetical protein